MTDTHTASGPPAGFATDLVDCWNRLPNKAFFFSLLAAWLLLFQFLGNATFGYVDTPSLFGWMKNSYQDDVDGNGDGHGKIIPLVVLVLMIWKRHKLLAVNFRVWWPALFMLAGALFLHLFGYVVQQPRISIVGLFVGIYALTGLAWGPGWLRASIFPFFLFVFSEPITSIGGPVAYVTFNLRLLVTHLVTLICNGVLGLDVLREGTQLYNAQHTYTFEVAAACSGLRSLISIFAICTVYGFVAFEKTWQRLLLMASAFPLAILGNMLRMLLIIMAASLEGQETGNYVHESTVFSLLPYVPAFLGIVWIEGWLKKVAGKAGRGASRNHEMNKQKLSILLVALAMMGGTAVTLHGMKAHQKLGLPGVKAAPIAGSQRMQIDLPEHPLGYESTIVPISEMVSNGLPHDTSFAQRQYISPTNRDDLMSLMVVLMGTDRTSIHKPQFCLKGVGWDFDDQNIIADTVPIEQPHAYDLPVARLMLHRQIVKDGKGETRSGIYIYWFVADHDLTGSHYARMWKSATHLLKTGELERWAYIGCLSVCLPGEEEATIARMKRFIAATVPEFQVATGPEKPGAGVVQSAAK